MFLKCFIYVDWICFQRVFFCKYATFEEKVIDFSVVSMALMVRKYGTCCPVRIVLISGEDSPHKQ